MLSLSPGGVRGTGNILRDLIFSTVPLPRVQVTGDQPHSEIQSSLSTRNETCSICGDISVSCQPLTRKEIEIVEELVLPSFTTSSPCGVTYLCHSCSSTLSRLTKLRQEIQDIIQCLRAVVKITRNKSKDKEGTKNRTTNIQSKNHNDTPANNSQPEAQELEMCAEEDVDYPNNIIDIKMEPIDQEDDDYHPMDKELDENGADDHHSESEIDVKTSPKEQWDKHEPFPEQDGKQQPHQVTGKRKSRVRAEELLHLMSQNDDHMPSPQINEDINEGPDFNYDEKRLRESVIAGPCKTKKIKQNIAKTKRNMKRKRSHHPPALLACVVCGEKFEDPETLESHKSQHSKDKCDVCHLTFKQEKDYHLHLSSEIHELGKTSRRKGHSGGVTVSRKCIPCIDCNLPFPTVLNLSAHYKRVHQPGTAQKWTPSDPLECVACGEKYQDLEALELHKSQHPKDKCDICDMTFKRAKCYELHLLSQTHYLGKIVKARNNNYSVDTVDDAVFACNKCDKVFRNAMKLSKHMKQTHEVVTTLKYCEPCNKRFKLTTKYKQHLLTDKHAVMAGGEKAFAELQALKTFQCDICNNKYMQENQLQRHKREFHDEEKIICDFCGKEFVTLSGFKQHMRLFHPSEAIVIPDRFIPPEDKWFKCKQCSSSFVDSTGLHAHLQSHGEPGYKCDVCPKNFRSRGAVRYHKATVHSDNSATNNFKIKETKTISCVFCLKIYRDNKNLGRHLELTHFVDRTACPFSCPDRIENDQEWLLHLEQCKAEKMMGQRKGSYYCAICRATFPNILLKIVHHLRAHTTQPCQDCDLSFSCEDVLFRHTIVHAGSERFICHKCGRRFFRPGGLRRHGLTCGVKKGSKGGQIISTTENNR